MYVCVDVRHMCANARRGCWITCCSHRWLWATPCECWKLNSGSLSTTETSLRPRMPASHCCHSTRALKPGVLVALRRVLSAMMQPDWQCQRIYFFSKPTRSQSIFTSTRWLNCYLINKMGYCHSAFRRLRQAIAGQLELYGYTLSPLPWRSKQTNRMAMEICISGGKNTSSNPVWCWDRRCMPSCLAYILLCYNIHVKISCYELNFEQNKSFDTFKIKILIKHFIPQLKYAILFCFDITGEHDFESIVCQRWNRTNKKKFKILRLS